MIAESVFMFILPETSGIQSLGSLSFVCSIVTLRIITLGENEARVMIDTIRMWPVPGMGNDK